MKHFLIACLCLLLILAALPATAVEEDHWLQLTVNTQQEADVLYAQYAEALNQADAHIIISGDSSYYMPFLQRFRFASLALDTPSVFGGGISVTELDHLTELRCSAGAAFSNAVELKSLTLRFSLSSRNVCISDLGDAAPNLEKLTLDFTGRKGYNIYFSNNCVWPETLKEIVITMDGDNVVPHNVAIGSVIAALKAVCPEAIVNGLPVSQLDETAGLTQEEIISVLQVDSAVTMTHYLRQLQAGTLNVLPGEPGIEGKLVILVFSKGTRFDLSTGSALTGDDFLGVPNEYLAAGMDEAQTAVIVYSDYQKAGTYTNRTIAYGCATMVAVVDLETGGMYEPYEAAYDAPASQIKGYESGSGSIQPEAALAELLLKPAE